MSNSSPYLAAAAVYNREPCARAFEHDLFLHLLHGFVINTPELFAMFRSVDSTWNISRLRDPSQTAPEGDTWWLWLVAGDPALLWNAFSPKKFLAFERVNSPRFHSYERLRRLWRPCVGARSHFA